MCEIFKNLFPKRGKEEKAKRLADDMSPYVEQIIINDIGLSPKIIRHNVLAELLGVDPMWLHEILLPPLDYNFRHYFNWDDCTWRQYIEGKFNLEDVKDRTEFVAIEATNIDILKQKFKWNYQQLQIIDAVTKALE